MRKTIILLITLILLMAGCSAGKNKQTLIVGMELAYPPFETKDTQGKPYGISVDIAKEFGKYLGRDVEIQNINWTGLIPALQTAKVDMVISSMTITAKRQESVDFSNAYAKAYLAFLVNKNSEVTLATDLNDASKTIAVKTGSTGDTYVTANYPKATILRLDDESAAMAEVLNKRADAFIYDQLTIYRNVLANNTVLKAVYIPNQKAEEWGAAFKKGSDLTKEFNAFLIKFKNDGGFAQLTEKHLKEEKKTFDELGFTFFFD
ncbi:MAG: transporter substrate-binding domain-containing protein [Erysipelotrichaceae bacterium]